MPSNAAFEGWPSRSGLEITLVEIAGDRITLVPTDGGDREAR